MNIFKKYSWGSYYTIEIIFIIFNLTIDAYANNGNNQLIRYNLFNNYDKVNQLKIIENKNRNNVNLIYDNKEMNNNNSQIDFSNIEFNKSKNSNNFEIKGTKYINKYVQYIS